MKTKVFNNKFWSIPKKPNPDKNKASLLELFFDLVLVAFLGGIVHEITNIIQYEGHINIVFELMFLFSSLITFIMVWANMTSYNSRYESFNIRHRVFTLVIMIGLIIVSTSVYIGFGKNMSKFSWILKVQFLGYGLTLFPIFYLHVSPCFKLDDKYEKRMLLQRAMGVACAMFFWTILFILNLTIAKNNQTKKIVFTSVFWTLGFISWLMFEWKSRSTKTIINVKENSLNHLQERFGIIFIAFIGESIIQIIVKSSENVSKNSTNTILYVIFAFLMLFSCWWWFNDIINYPDLINHPKRINFYYITMMMMLFSLAIIAIGISLTIQDFNLWYGKMFLATGLSFWFLNNALIFTNFKKYKAKHNVFFPNSLRKFVFLTPIFAWLFLWLGYTHHVSSASFLIVSMSFTIFLVSVTTFIMIKQQRYVIENEYRIKKIISDFEITEEAWIESETLKYGDARHHAKYDYELNHYSQYIKKETTNTLI